MVALIWEIQKLASAVSALAFAVDFQNTPVALRSSRHTSGHILVVEPQGSFVVLEAHPAPVAFLSTSPVR